MVERAGAESAALSEGIQRTLPEPPTQSIELEAYDEWVLSAVTFELLPRTSVSTFSHTLDRCHRTPAPPESRASLLKP